MKAGTSIAAFGAPMLGGCAFPVDESYFSKPQAVAHKAIDPSQMRIEGEEKIVGPFADDNFLQGRPDLEDTIRRLSAFAEAGADVLYAPYPPDMNAVVAIVKAVAPKPVNLVVGTMSGTLPVADVLRAGVKRISLGVALYTRVMGDLRKAAKELASGDLASATTGISFREVLQLIANAPNG